MKDFLGNELSINDNVVFMQLRYRNLLKGKIVSLTKYKVKISHEETNTCYTETIQFPNQVIKISTANIVEANK